MFLFLRRRIITASLTVAAVSLLIFMLSRAQGDPRLLYLSADTTAEQYAAWSQSMGLDKPLIVQYGIWAGQAIRGNIGISLSDRRPVVSTIMERLPATLLLGLSSLIFTILVGIPLGVLSATQRGTLWDYLGRGFALFGQALPVFWVALMLIFLFSVELGWLPSARRGGISHYVLPTIALGWTSAAALLRLVRSSMLDVLDSEYVKLARSKGVGRTAVIWKHAFRNSLIAPLTFGGVLLAGKFTGAVVTETIFAWPGIGRLAISAVYNNDFPLLSGVILFFMLAYVTLSLIVDIAYGFIDPRIRYT